jgi:hypothetical protein
MLTATLTYVPCNILNAVLSHLDGEYQCVVSLRCTCTRIRDQISCPYFDRTPMWKHFCMCVDRWNSTRICMRCQCGRGHRCRSRVVVFENARDAAAAMHDLPIFAQEHAVSKFSHVLMQICHDLRQCEPMFSDLLLSILNIAPYLEDTVV